MSETTSESALVLARSLIAEADRKVDSIEKSIFHLTSKSNKYESAAELFMKAAKQYQAAKAHIDAGNAYIRACDCYSRSNNNYNSHNMATCYVQAAQNFSKQDVTAGIAAMLKGISIMTEEGKFDRAAKHEKEIAELFETIGDYDNAIKHYEIAGDYYETEGSKTTGAGCLEKIVPLVAEKGDFHRAVELIEKICDSYSTTLAKHSIKDLCLKAGILYLCIPDNIAANKSLEKWLSKYNNEFRNTREFNFLAKLIKAAIAGDSENFKNSIEEWETISSLDSFKRTYLDKALEKIQLADEEDDDFT